MIKVGIVGLGKMGLSHCAMLNAHPNVALLGVCDSSAYPLRVLNKYTGIPTFPDIDTLLTTVEIDALVVATPSSTHASLVRSGLDHDLSVFCEKPFTLAPQDAELLTSMAAARGLITQVGYHNRFVAAFAEVKRLLDLDAIGPVTHILGEAYGPVVLKPSGGTWRSRRAQGGGCLYDYAAHVINLVTWYLGEPIGVGGTAINRVFSREIDDEVSSTMFYPAGATAQISANWSDESYRKMTTRLTLWGNHGSIFVDRQECRVYLRESAALPDGYNRGWNARYTTDLTRPVWFYLRGEEYSAQLEHFVQRVSARRPEGENAFATATITDKVIAAMVEDSGREPTKLHNAAVSVSPLPARRWRLRRPRIRDRP